MPGTTPQPQTYLVTGGAGFIGSHLVEALLHRGDRVVVLDNFSSGRRANLAGVEGHPGLRVVQGSVLDELVVEDLVRQCDVVVHLAAAVGVRLIVEQPLASLTTNLRGCENVVEAAWRHRRTVLLTSSSEIYGKNSTGPLPEDADRILGSPSVVRWAYSTAKAVDEILLNAYHRERGLPTIIARLFNTVGPRQSAAYGMVIPRLARQAVTGHPLTVYGTGEQTRCFVHVADVVDALLRLLATPAAIGQTVNIGAADEISIRRLADLVVAAAGSPSPIELVPYHEAYGSGFEDMHRRVPDTRRLRELTGWSPRHTLHDVLAAAIAEARAEAAAPVPQGQLVAS
ncbi:NAD-dependent epimerase/dehydratase family protein [Dactylosporangium sp. NPDC049742]|uniref:NAD-dependent epimerase/dehydratase family protein n=1 Tax=Dactylosporangium sp. NPDC049742 TaxID=3154737 RepID=UPI0034194A18